MFTKKGDAAVLAKLRAMPAPYAEPEARIAALVAKAVA
ncbi:hypothetical protein TSOC111612_21795 [Tsukamurella ocularis]